MIALHPDTIAATESEVRHFLRGVRPPRRLTMREFAVERIRLPNGPHAGEPLSIETQPYVGHWLDAIDSGNWTEFVAVGPMQSGKTIAAFAVPTLYHVLEIGEDTIVGLPTAEMAGDKWSQDLRPVIAASSCADLLPVRGAGSKDAAKLDSITLRNGATLKFMSGGGSDKKRAGFTARALSITEADGLDTAGTKSRESDKVTQMQGRQRAYARRDRRLYEECTASTSAGRIWRRYLEGTQSTIYCRCPHCRHYVCLEREDLHGWQDAADELAAASSAAWYCNACGECWSTENQRQANLDSVLVHQGQQIDPATGKISGAPKPSQTFSIRWSAVNNLFVSAGDIAIELYRQARHDSESDEYANAEKAIRQAVFALPYDPPALDVESISANQITSRRRRSPRGQAPADVVGITVGIDIGKYTAHLVVIAFCADGRALVIDYYVFDVPSQGPGQTSAHGIQVEEAVIVAITATAEVLESGVATADGRTIYPSRVLIDAGFEPDSVHAACRALEHGRHTRDARYMPAIGRGTGQHDARRYAQPSRKGNTVREIGHQWYVSRHGKQRTYYVTADADHWKSRVHQGLTAPPGPGGIELFEAPAKEHLTFAKHISNEEQVTVFVPGRGNVVRWKVNSRRPNHYFDAFYLALVAGDISGLRLSPTAKEMFATQIDAQHAGQNAAEWLAGRTKSQPKGSRHA